jgi:hypothetical protein
MKKKQFTDEQVNSLTKDELKRFIVSYGDGQGDTYLITLYDMMDGYENDDIELTNMQALDELWNEHGGNMVNIAWIEDNALVKIDIIIREKSINARY